MFVRAKTFRELNGLDTQFFAHMEEIDLCWRMHRHGYKVYYCGSSSVYHVGGGTLSKNNPRKTYLNFRNNLLMIHKNAGSRRSSILLFRQVFDLLAALKFLISNGYPDFSAVLKAHKDFSKMKKQYPHETAGRIEAFDNSTIFDNSVLWDYYLRNRKTFGGLKWLK
jgi:GT2 family glycosyltransferase